MTLEGLYAAALMLYPLDYRVRFGSEMRAAFAAAAHENRSAGLVTFAAFLVAEGTGIITAAAREWTFKLTTDPAARARLLPDCRRMRPVGVTRAEWAAGLDDVR
jgi:hypothetical protein